MYERTGMSIGLAALALCAASSAMIDPFSDIQRQKPQGRVEYVKRRREPPKDKSESLRKMLARARR